MKIQLFYTADLWSPITWFILSASGGKYSHTGLLFTATNEEWIELCKRYEMFRASGIRACTDGSYRFYFESKSSKDKRTGKTGVRGPYPFKKLAAWQHRRSYRRLEIQNLPLEGEGIWKVIERLVWAVAHIKYAYRQIWQNWMQLRWGRGTPLRKRERDRWTCSETDVRTLREGFPNFVLDVLQLGDINYEEYPPSSSKGAGLYELVEGSKSKQGEE